MTFTIRPAAPEDSLPISDLLRRLNRGMRAYTIYGCAGLEAYLHDTLEQGPERSGALFIVCCHDGRVGGVGEWRRMSDHLFWNHHYLLPAYRRKKLGQRLLLEAIQRTRDLSYNEMRHDIFVDNTESQRWSRSLGFFPVAEKYWLRASLPPPGAPPASYTVHDLPQADHRHARYGFSQFGLETAAGRYRIGRLGDAFFRATTLSILEDEAALGALYALDARRDLLCIGLGTAPTTKLSTTVVARSIHSAGEIATVLENLTHTLETPPYS